MSKKASVKKAPETVSEKFIEKFYSIQAEFTDEEGRKLDIPESGFLGLLATGYKGLALIRKKRDHTHIYAKFTKGKKLVKRKRKKGIDPDQKEKS